ncbi:hypothetical protein [Streptomyces sp. H34-S4]|uniref:hypothetical protein n=1 Tax=Streptomyces sp. H34-S4 TaxID=2996463 RepID=UPI00226E3789|nr:hypothetical protein [Streptomyces sp. H34-S4]MCY0937544.1 hypothetical protein [Streptomyces sp. H34-S4]
MTTTDTIAALALVVAAVAAIGSWKAARGGQMRNSRSVERSSPARRQSRDARSPARRTPPRTATHRGLSFLTTQLSSTPEGAPALAGRPVTSILTTAEGHLAD